MKAASWDAYRCAYTQATQDGSGPTWHAHLGACGENYQCEYEAREGNCQKGIDWYYAQGPGEVHYDIIMGNHCYMAWGLCDNCSPDGIFLTNTFYPCKDATAEQNVTTVKRTGRPVMALKLNVSAKVL